MSTNEKLNAVLDAISQDIAERKDASIHAMLVLEQMNNIQELINEIQLLHANKADLIEAMQDVGIDVSEKDPLSIIAERMKEAGGMCCITKIATVEQTPEGDYRHRFFSIEEWQSMDPSIQQNYPRIGVLLIAEGHRLIISKSYQTLSAENDAITMRWSTGAVDIAGMTNYGDSTYGMILDFDSRGNTEKILAHATTLAEGYIIAPLRAHQYRGCLNDPTYWCLPAMGHMMLIAKYRNEINEALNVIGGVLISTSTHWTSTEYGVYNVWCMELGSASVSYTTKTSATNLVRSVSAI